MPRHCSLSGQGCIWELGFTDLIAAGRAGQAAAGANQRRLQMAGGERLAIAIALEDRADTEMLAIMTDSQAAPQTALSLAQGAPPFPYRSGSRTP